jgi:hypothetical protein
MEPNDLNEAHEPARVEGLKHEWRVEGSRHGNTKPRLPHLSHMRRQAQARPQRQELLTIDPAAHILGRPISQQDLVHLDALRFAGQVEPSSGPLAGRVHAQGQPHHPGSADRATLRGRRAARRAANHPGDVWTHRPQPPGSMESEQNPEPMLTCQITPVAPARSNLRSCRESCDRPGPACLPLSGLRTF